ncbi:hypothetical protein PUN28_009533 [Cardiocondyla obscurior]|uniref:Uncharacterized protein n=1 Tax=Cardiocondyla obscurior TaxID=286306 RepID=A0AAW2FSM9_9HYME
MRRKTRMRTESDKTKRKRKMRIENGATEECEARVSRPAAERKLRRIIRVSAKRRSFVKHCKMAQPTILRRWPLCQNSNCVRRRPTRTCSRTEIGALHKCNNIERRCYCIVNAALYHTARRVNSFFLTTYSMSNFLSSNHALYGLCVVHQKKDNVKRNKDAREKRRAIFAFSNCSKRISVIVPFFFFFSTGMRK